MKIVFPISRWATSLLAGMGVLFVTACANLDIPAEDALYQQAMSGISVPPQWAASAQAAAFQPEWAGFGSDSTLQALIDEALANNLDLRIAASRVRQASYQASLAGADLLPTVGIGARAATDPTPGSSVSANGYAIMLNWEIDLWGRARAEKQSGEAQYRSAEADYAYARQSLAAMTARSWLAVLETNQQLALAREQQNVATDQLKLMAARLRIGKVSEQDVATWSAQVAATADVVAQRQQAHEQALRALELVLGRYPGAAVQAGEILPEAPTSLAPGLPLELLNRRPDITAARERLIAAYFGAEEAKAARLPAISIFAGAGRFTKDYSGLSTSVGDWIFPVGASLIWPVFDAGRRQTVFELRTEEQRVATSTYARIILGAMGEVENGLTAEQQLELRSQALARQLSEMQRSFQLAQVQRRIGKADDFDVLQRKRDVLQAESAVVRIRAERLVQRVNLHLALGGRFE